MRLESVSKVFPNIPRYTYFRAKTVYTGSRGGMSFRIEPFDEIKVYIWHGKFCFEKSEIDVEKTFPQTEEGYYEMLHFLEDYAVNDEKSNHTRWESYEGWEYEYALDYATKVNENRCNGRSANEGMSNFK